MDTVELTLSTLLAALRRTGCERPHVALAGQPVYVPAEAAPALERAAVDELSGLGLARGTSLTDDFTDLLHLLATPELDFHAHVRTGDEEYAVLVAARGREAAVVVRDGNRVWLRSSRDPDHAATLVAHLPEFAPARFTPFSVDRAELRAERRRSAEARELDEILGVPRYGWGYLQAAHRDRRGDRRQAGEDITYLDIDAGRIGFTPAGGGYLTVLPGTPDNLAAKLAALR
ncbi:ESX secretion-associated protein EspG [Amycolatopsis suaedae]|uniref:ESX secretion-associated protein EspG n=1 Tax=Amycolatopsis suaedae TaxID=2510978 RepID=A0A4Q7J4U9_9PSEU|nr:ESX secretion-associated protein EspG [Amycolatopsis suaedae]RZQ62067.1 ESX secretion-associated protein EspG [Amycolatopsis suaedae]